MSFKEILESIGLTAEQVTAVETGMQEAGIYLASEEGLDQKYADVKKELEKYDGAVIDDGSKDTRIAELEQETGRGRTGCPVIKHRTDERSPRSQKGFGGRIFLCR